MLETSSKLQEAEKEISSDPEKSPKPNSEGLQINQQKSDVVSAPFCRAASRFRVDRLLYGFRSGTMDSLGKHSIWSKVKLIIRKYITYIAFEITEAFIAN